MCAYPVVAEDDPKQAELIRLCLERERALGVVAEDGLTALEQPANAAMTFSCWPSRCPT